ncbi:MAG: hypothetical protein ABR540_17880 [Acidimicrobiales bacterium]
MTQSAEPSRTPFSKSSGITDTERYLEQLCERNFLSFWSYPRPFRDQGGNKEICDLVVVMGDDAIIFSDKHCSLTPKKTLEIDWQRWFRSAVQAGAGQAWGAERWFRDHPHRVFLNPECTERFPVPLPAPDRARYHLVVTVHGVAAACQTMLGGTGSLVLRSDTRGLEAHTEPFVIGDLDLSRSFVHVFDDVTLEIVMSTLDTAADFIRYLSQKELLFRSRTILAAGEENLLAFYLARVDNTGGHAFVFGSDHDAVVIDDTWWSHFRTSQERRAQREHDEVSYVWDRLIERFAEHALKGSQYFATAPPVTSAEIILRFMAAEPRLRRRYLAGAFIDALEQTPPNLRRLRVVPRQFADEPMYVFLLFPWRDDRSEEQNRAVRRKYLEACVHVAKLKYSNAIDIIGIATESGIAHTDRSEDAVYVDARTWSVEDEEYARELQRDLDILTAEQATSTAIVEYPVERQAGSTLPFVRSKHPTE